MAFRDVRDFIGVLDKHGELVHISAPIDPILEIAEITDRVSKGPASTNKALLFENVKGSSMPVLINGFGSARRMALALGVEDLDELNHRLAALLDFKLPQGMQAAVTRGMEVLGALRSVGLKPDIVGRAPCQEVVETERPSLAGLPILQCWPLDGGRYITLPQVITRDPVTHQRNVGMYRLQVYDDQTLGMHWQLHKGGAEHERVAREAGQERIPVAVALGGDPAEMWCGSAPLPPGIDEYLLAGWLRGKPVQLVKCLTQPLEVPADAEIILEGYVDPAEHRAEGPFGDHTGYYTPLDLYPVLHLTGVTHRKNPIYPTTIVGRPPMEDYWMGKATERLFLPLMRLFLSEIVDMNMPAEGVFHNVVIVSIKKRFPGHARKVMYGLWGLGLMMLAKAIIVVDSTVDVQNLSEVAWQVAGNVDWQRDTVIVQGAVDALDHASTVPAYGGKIGIDATAKGPMEGYTRGWPTPIEMSSEIRALVDRRWAEYGLGDVGAVANGRKGR